MTYSMNMRNVRASAALHVTLRCLACGALLLCLGVVPDRAATAAAPPSPAGANHFSASADTENSTAIPTGLADKSAEQSKVLPPEIVTVDQERELSAMKSKYEIALHDTQTEIQGQRDYVQSLESSNRELLRTIYILSMLAAVSTVLFSLFLYRKFHAASRLLREAKLKLEIQSTRDPLTGLLNRRAFQDSMRERMKVVDRRLSDVNQPPHVLALFDIDHFKLINDRFGHAIGDAVLIEVTGRLTQIMREHDKLMRWSGEEFLLFLNNISVANLESVMQRVLCVIGDHPIIVEGKTLNVTMSAGYVALPVGLKGDVDENWEKSLKLADAALYKAKINGRNQAVGIPDNQIAIQDLDAMLTINLDELAQQNRIVINQLMGPLQRENLSEKFAADC